jgi:hypothetical protein
MAVPTGTVCLTDLRTEFGDANGGNVCLTEYYAGGANVGSGTTNGSGTAIPSSGTLCLKSNFAGAQSAISTVNNQIVGSASFAQIVTSFNNFVVGGGSWQLVNKSLTTGVSGELQHFWYIQEASSQLGGSYNGSAMTTGFNYGWHRVTFNSANIPDSYYIDVTHTLTQLDSALNADAAEIAGTGETYTSGANWDSAVKTLLPTSNSGGTAFKVFFTANDECDDFSIYWTTNIKIYYRKSGYPDLLAVNRDITTEIDGYWSASICQ